MAKWFSRKELYDLVWSEPMKTLSAQFGISDVALKKTCARAAIPTPDRGYWAKREASKKTFQVALPKRAPGMDDVISVAGGGNSWYRNWNEKEFLGPLPSPPEFPEPIEAVREWIANVAGEVTVPLKVNNWHPAIDRLLKEDDRRREKQLAASYPMSWDNPLFDTPFERRRLRILNSLFFAAARMNGKPVISGREARSVHLAFYQQHAGIRLDQSKQSVAAARSPTKQPGSNDTKLSLSILQSPGSEKERMTWQDDDSGQLETHMTEIVVQLILTSEIQYREHAIHQYQWRVKRKAELEEEERQRKLETERAGRERQKRIEQARIDRLLKHAAAFQQASEIRKYVDAIRLAPSHNGLTSTEELDRWSEWALAQADRIDPITGRAFLMAMQEENA